MTAEAEATTTTIAICISCIVITVVSELFIMRPLFTQRMRRHEHRSALTTLVLLFVGMGMMPVLYSTGFFIVFLERARTSLPRGGGHLQSKPDPPP
jgi:hypothetical protein